MHQIPRKKFWCARARNIAHAQTRLALYCVSGQIQSNFNRHKGFAQGVLFTFFSNENLRAQAEFSFLRVRLYLAKGRANSTKKCKILISNIFVTLEKSDKKTDQTTSFNSRTKIYTICFIKKVNCCTFTSPFCLYWMWHWIVCV